MAQKKKTNKKKLPKYQWGGQPMFPWEKQTPLIPASAMPQTIQVDNTAQPVASPEAITPTALGSAPTGGGMSGLAGVAGSIGAGISQGAQMAGKFMNQAITAGIPMLSSLLPDQDKRRNSSMFSYAAENQNPMGTGSQAIYRWGGSTRSRGNIKVTEDFTPGSGGQNPIAQNVFSPLGPSQAVQDMAATPTYNPAFQSDMSEPLPRQGITSVSFLDESAVDPNPPRKKRISFDRVKDALGKISLIPKFTGHNRKEAITSLQNLPTEYQGMPIMTSPELYKEATAGFVSGSTSDQWQPFSDPSQPYMGPMQSGGVIPFMGAAASGIHIKPENKGKFTASANAAGMGVQAFASKVLSNKEDYSSTQVKRANFARNAAKWNKGEHGLTVHEGGEAETISTNPFSNPMVQFNGDSHAEGGITIDYAGTPAEVEGGETGYVDNQGSMTVFGNLYIPGTSTKFKTAGKDIAKEEEANNKALAKSGKHMAKFNPDKGYEAISYNSARLSMEGAMLKQKELSHRKDQLAAMQQRMLDFSNMMGVEPDKLYGKKGLKIPGYQTGGQVGVDMMQFANLNLTPITNPTPELDQSMQARMAGENAAMVEDARATAQQLMGAEAGVGEQPGQLSPQAGDDEINARLKKAFGQKESGDNYFIRTKIKDKSGQQGSAFGKYQFTRSTRKEYYNDYFQNDFKSFNDFDKAFTSTPELQEKVMTTHLNTLRNKYNNNVGYVALAHLMGEGAVDNYLKTGKLIYKGKSLGVDDKLDWGETPRQYVAGIAKRVGVDVKLEKGGKIPKYQYGTDGPITPQPIQPLDTYSLLGLVNPRTPVQPMDFIPTSLDSYQQELRAAEDQNLAAAMTASKPVLPQASVPPMYKKKKLQTLSQKTGLSPLDVLPELSAMFERPDPVPFHQYQPQMFQAQTISLQDQLNQNTSNFRAVSRNLSQTNPAAVSALAAQKYEADQKVLAEQFRINQGMASETFNKNIDLRNQAQLQNINFADQAAVRASQAKSAAKATRQNALKSLTSKTSQAKANKLNMELIEKGIAKGNWAFDPQGNLAFQGPDHIFSPTVGPSPAAQAAVASNVKTFKMDGKDYVVQLDQNGQVVGQPVLVEDAKKKAAYYGTKLRRI